MALVAQQFDIPLHLANVDSDAAYSGGGAPSHAGLGRRLFENDRVLSANNRRGFSEAFPQSDLPTVSSAHGINIGPWDFLGTPGVTNGEFYLVAKIATGDTMYITPYRNKGNDDFTGVTRYDTVYALTGTGSAKRYGPYDVSLIPGHQTIGFVLTSEIDTGTSVKSGTIAAWYNNKRFRVVNSGDLTGYTGKAVIFSDISGSGNGETTWHDLIAIEDSDIGGHVNDVGVIYPPLHESIAESDGARQNQANMDMTYFEVQNMSEAELHCITFREKPTSSFYVTDNGQNSGFPYSPISNDLAFSNSHFTTTPWNTLANNNQHLYGTRGRIVVDERFLDIDIPSPMAEVARFNFDSTPGEDYYLMRLVYSTPVVGSEVTAEARVIVSDTAGATSKTSPDWNVYGHERKVTTDKIRQFPWPIDAAKFAHETAAGSWVWIEADSSLATSNRLLVLKMWKVWNGACAQNAPKLQLKLRGVTIIGMSRGRG